MDRLQDQWTSDVFFHAIDPIIIEDVDGIILDLNPQAVSIYGFEKEELVGQPITAIVPPEQHVQARELLQRCLAGEEVKDVEGVRWDRTERRIPVLLALSPLKNARGEVFAIATFAKDLTELRSAQVQKDQMAQVFMDAIDPIILEDMRGNIIDVNKETIRNYGFSREELIGKPIRTLVPPERHPQAIDLLERCLAGENVRGIEGLRWTKDKEIIDVLLALSPLRNQEGEISAIATIAKDITKLKQTEAQLDAEKEKLEIRVNQRTQELQSAQNNLKLLADKLSHYISPQLHGPIFEGKQDAAVGAQRRWLTVYFSDIAGFTKATESLDPEELTTLLNDYFFEMNEIVLKYGGTLDKYIGDAIMIFFGDPETKGREEDARLCVSMALEMQRRVESLHDGWTQRGIEQPLQFRSGIASGYCTVGNFGSDQHLSYTCIGRHVNLANRLETAAQPGQVLMSKSTWLLVEKNFETIQLEPISAKGFEQPVEAYLVVGENSEKTRPTVFQKSAPGFSVWLDPETISEDERRSAADYLKKLLQSIDNQADRPL
ncbi:MAG: PAS domain S-box protein [Rhizobiaceae bacterium]